MARKMSRKRKRMGIEPMGMVTFMSDSEEQSEDEEDVIKEERNDEGRVLRSRSTLDEKGKGKAVVKEEDEKSFSGNDCSNEEQKLNDEVETDQICGICLNKGETERGKLDCCDHFFCLNCILEWSKVESKCPMCKQRFVTVMRPSVPGVLRSRCRTYRIPTRDQVYEPTEDEIRLFIDPYENTACIECHQAGDEGLLLLCDQCDAAAHTYCVGLGRSVPRGDWFCEECLTNLAGSSEDEDEVRYLVQDPEVLRTSVSTSTRQGTVGSDSNAERRGRPRRTTRSNQEPPPLRRSSRRLGRALRATTALVNSISFEARSGMFPSSVFQYMLQARTLSRQREVRATVQSRVQSLRENWDRYQRGEAQFSALTNALEGSSLDRGNGIDHGGRNAEQEASSGLRQGSTARSTEQAEVDQAWAMMDQARQLDRPSAAASRGASTSHRRNLSEVVELGVRDRCAQEAVHSSATTRGVREVLLNTRSASSSRTSDANDVTVINQSARLDDLPESSARRELSRNRGSHQTRDGDLSGLNAFKDVSTGTRQLRSRREPQDLQVRSSLDEQETSRGPSGCIDRRREVDENDTTVQTSSLLDDKENCKRSGSSSRRSGTSKDPQEITASPSEGTLGENVKTERSRKRDCVRKRCPEKDDEIKYIKNNALA